MLDIFLFVYFSFIYLLKKGIKNIIHATKKNKLPNIAQKFPMLDTVKPIADTINKIQPSKFIFLFFIFFD
tara:strand:+ start:1009 stop:1218 length:210 start_codon:yes stop_codon:yes gene_type:complete